MMIDSVSAAGTWWCPSLSLSAEAEMTACRQAAARMSRDELAVHLDAMIITCFNQRAVIKAATHHVAGLEAKGGAPVTEQHLEWARELMNP
jgi:hypothetical protein